jgi:hypothetical protein
MQGMIRCGYLAGVLCACHSSQPATPDGQTLGDADRPGLFVTWATQPPSFPETLETWLTLDSVALEFENFKVIGDAGPGDTRTTATGIDLNWATGHTPYPISFDNAPPGLYSKVSFQLDGHTVEPSFDLRGQLLQLDGTWQPYEIEDRDQFSLSLDIDRTLQPGGSVTIAMVLALHDALANIDYGSLPVDDGRLTLGTDDPQMDAFLNKLDSAFSVDGGTPQ